MSRCRLALLFILFVASCATMPEPPQDLRLRSVRVIDAREHPLYAGWTVEAPLAHVLDITYSSDADLLAYGGWAGLPYLQNVLNACPRGGSSAAIGTFADAAYWSELDRERNGPYAFDYAAYRSDWPYGGSFIYHAYALIAANGGAASGAYAHDLQNEPEDLCLNVTFTDFRNEQHSNIIIVPREAVVAALQGMGLTPGERYKGPRLP